MPIELKVKEATSLDSWPASTTLMDEIVDATYSSLDLAHIFRLIWDRLSSPAKNYLHIHKALILLEYLILHGSDSVLEQTRSQIYRVRTLKDFHHTNEEGKDVGKPIKARCRRIVELLTDESLLTAEQAEAQRLRSRIKGSDGSSSLSGLSSERHARAKTSTRRIERASSVSEERPLEFSPVKHNNNNNNNNKTTTTVTPQPLVVEQDLLDLGGLEISKPSNDHFFTDFEAVSDVSQKPSPQKAQNSNDFFTDFEPKEVVKHQTPQKVQKSNDFFSDFDTVSVQKTTPQKVQNDDFFSDFGPKPSTVQQVSPQKAQTSDDFFNTPKTSLGAIPVSKRAQSSTSSTMRTQTPQRDVAAGDLLSFGSAQKPAKTSGDFFDDFLPTTSTKKNTSNDFDLFL
ncbi:hypothetical protein RCL1_004794 [Eukaryota sp. TZLM3-RCL]